MRLIDADALKERLKEYCIDGDEQAMQWYDIMGIDETIDNAPTIDAVPVVRCKDCFLFGECKAAEWYGENGNGYCSVGDRRKER